MKTRNGAIRRIGFIGVGVMGEPMCRHLAQKAGVEVVAFDRDPAPLDRLAGHGVRAVGSIRDVFAGSDIVSLSLPSGEIVSELSRQPGGLLECAEEGQIVIDHSTTAVETTRQLALEFADRGVTLVDAPVARTRAAAEAGTLLVMVGADGPTFQRIRPLLGAFASDVVLCGAVGCGQVVKILNNLVLFEIGASLAEAKSIGVRSGVEPRLLFETLARGSADSFALRNHGMKAMLTDDFPLRAFSVEYARKDLRYAVRLAEDVGVSTGAARLVDQLFERAIQGGSGAMYWPVISQFVAAR